MPTYTDLRNGFRLGPWEVLPDRGLLRDGDTERHLEPKMVDVLVLLAAQPGQVVSKEQLIESVWDGRAQTDEPLNRCVSVLRRELGDDSSNPTFIETIPRRGYRLKMPVTMPELPEEEGSTVRGPYWIGLTAAAVTIFLIYLFGWRTELSETPVDVNIDTPMTSIAVFPFHCPGTTENFLCFGFSDALTSTLLHAAGIKVVKLRTPFPDQDSPQDIAKRLGVDGLLSGSVQRMGDDVRIAAELLDGRNGFVVLSDTLNGKVEDIFRLQEQVATIVGRSIGGDSGGTLQAASRPSSFEAFEAYARGQYQFALRNKESIEEAIELFQQTIRLDPKFGPAYLQLAYAYALLPDYDPSLVADAMYELALATTNTGIMADPGIAKSAGTIFGYTHHKRGEWRQATDAFETAVTADSVYPIAHQWYSGLLASVGRLDDALYQARRAYELDPDSAVIISRLAIASFWVGDLEKAEHYFAVVSKMKHEAPIHNLAVALFLLQKGQVSEAIVATKIGLEKFGMNSDWVKPVFAGLENPERRSQSSALLSQLEADGLLPSYIVMPLWALLGDADRAMHSAMATENFSGSYVAELLYVKQLRIVREHKDFPLLLEKNGLPEYWKKVGCKWVDSAVQCEK